MRKFLKKLTELRYSIFKKETMILRDHLAADRTKMAAERTLLSYSRTSLMLLVTGITFLKLFSEEIYFVVLSLFLIPGSILLFLFGMVRFILSWRHLKELTPQLEETPFPDDQKKKAMDKNR